MDNSVEVWKDVDGFSGRYQVSTMGNVRRKGWHESVKIPVSISKDRHISVCLTKGKIRRLYRIERLVANAFLHNNGNFTNIRFKDGNPRNCNVNNIEWIDFESLHGEEWKGISFAKNEYQVSNFGRVRRYRQGVGWCLIKGRIGKVGYYRVSLNVDGKIKDFFVHRLVAMAFIPNPGNKPQVDHINTIRTDNRVENLRWVTPHENMMNEITRKTRSIINKTNVALMEKCIKTIQDWNAKPESKEWCKKLHEMAKIPVIGVDITTGKVYNYSCANDAKKDGFSQSAIAQCLRMNYPNKLGKNIYKGVKWERAI